MSDPTETISGIIPAVIVGGVAMKMFNDMTSQTSRRRTSYRTPKRQARKGTLRSRTGFGNFSNVGF